MGWLHWADPRDGANRIYLLAAIFGVAAGAASAVAIIVEVAGRLMLLIPAAARKIPEEGREQGREEGRMEERTAWEAWLRRRDAAETNQVPFDEPPPSKRE